MAFTMKNMAYWKAKNGNSPMKQKSNYSQLSIEERAKVHGMNLPEDEPMTSEEKEAENYQNYQDIVIRNNPRWTEEAQKTGGHWVEDLDDPIYDDVREKFKYNPEADYSRMRMTNK